MKWLSERVCRWFGHNRDWPEMERCCRCNVYMPLTVQMPIDAKITEIESLCSQHGISIEFACDPDPHNPNPWDYTLSISDSTKFRRTVGTYQMTTSMVCGTGSTFNEVVTKAIDAAHRTIQRYQQE